MPKMSFAATALFTLLAGSAAAGQPTQERDCHDDNGVDRCTEEQQRRVRQAYGVRSIEEHREAGDQVRRVFFVDGYGRDLVLIAFTRVPESDPTVRVHYPQRERQLRSEPMEAPVPQPVWDEVLWRSREFERTFVPRSGEDPSICLHSWVFTIEAVDRPRGRLPAELRRKTEDSCENGPASIYAREIQRLALPLFPHCAALDPNQHRNSATMLDVCRLLHGDRLSAAEVFNLAVPFRRVSTREEAALINGRFDHEAVVNWNGASNTGQVSARDFWVERMLAEREPSFYFESVHGERSDRVRLTAALMRPVESPDGRERYFEHADVEQIWVRDFNGEMKIERATVGPGRRHSIE